MNVNARRPALLPTSVVGSHGLPGWVWLAREALEAGRLGALDVRELAEDATQIALLDQSRARRGHALG
jgi:methionine synthase II (cobalamin-independent)